MDATRPWAGCAQWRVLHAGRHALADFLAAWQAWRDDPQAPRRLHFVAIVAAPPSPDQLLAATDSALRPLAQELADRWFGLVPGFHRFAFAQGRVLLTLCVGELQAMLREQAFRADALFLDALTPQTVKALPRHCRRGALLVADAPSEATLHDLASCGFEAQGPRESALRARYAPRWQVKGLPAGEAVEPGSCVVIGAGLAGAAAAASLARRGWQVQVVDSAPAPASGASALPAGLMAPHQSPDDNLLSRLTRAGVRIGLDECARLLALGSDWAPTGVLEHRGADARPLPPVGEALAAWSRAASAGEKARAGLAPQANAWWHASAGWVRPAALVRAWLAQPGIAFRGGCAVREVLRDGDGWLLRAPDGTPIARAALVVVAAAGGSAPLLGGRIAVHPVRGQVSWNLRQPGDAALPPFPLNGNGHLLPDVPLPEGRAWLSGSSYGRGDADARPRAEDHLANLQRLRELAPAVAGSLEPQFRTGAVRAWSGVRWASTDRRPLVGEVEPGLWVSTAMGSRGLSFAALCGEWIAARLHGEPWPLEARLAQALELGRQLR